MFCLFYTYFEGFFRVLNYIINLFSKEFFNALFWAHIFKKNVQVNSPIDNHPFLCIFNINTIRFLTISWY
jgi:hypothetical protein